MAKQELSWEEKQAKGLPLSPLEQVKADATRVTLKRIKDNEENQAIQEQKFLQTAVRAQERSRATQVSVPEKTEKA